MIIDNKILLGKAGEKEVFLRADRANRHGLIAGATGTGKTVTLQVISEAFSEMGVPVFLSDIKGDLSGLCKVGGSSESVTKRVEEMGLEGFEYKSYPVKFFDVFGENGHPIRSSISEMGPILLSRLLDLSEVQEGVLTIVFRIADEHQLKLIDLKDLRALLTFVGDHAKDLTLEYGNVTKQSIGAIQRALLQLEDSGGDFFFGEPGFDINDWIRTDEKGYGYINILNAVRLHQTPIVYSTFLLWLLSELYETLPELGDVDKPKMVFCFDEAHLLFDDAPKALLTKIEQIVRLIRSKGVSVFFITQNPTDIPETVLSQLSNRIQHALRAFTPKELKVIKAVSDGCRANPEFDTEKVMLELKTGEALVSCLLEDGTPDVVNRTLICPPHSYIGAVDQERIKTIISISELYGKYDTCVDNESAYEILNAKAEETAEQKDEKTGTGKATGVLSALQKATTTAAGTFTRETAKDIVGKVTGTYNSRKSPLEKALTSLASSLSTTFGRTIARGLFGSIKK